MVAIPFPLSSSPGRRPNESQGRLINCYSERQGDADRWRRAPGLRAFADLGHPTVRGSILVGNLLYVAVEDHVVTVDAAANVTELSGSVDGSGPVTWAQNNKSPTPDIMLVSGNGVYTVTSTAVTPFSNTDLPAPNSVSFLDGYFLFSIGDGRVFASGLNDTTIDALSFARCEAKPDGLLRGIVTSGAWYGCGPSTIEVWNDAGTSPFPLARVAVIPIGIAGPLAISGFEDGWDLSPIFVASDGTVRQLNGYQPLRISTYDVERDIEGVADKSTLEACVFTAAGNAMWALSSDSWTWVYNTTNGRWHERRSYGGARWRAGRMVRAFGKWLAGDTQSNSLLEVTEQAQREVDQPLVARIESAPIKSFPARMQVPATYFDFTVGLGDERGIDPIETEPQVMIAWSDDGSATWATPLNRSLGRQGESKKQVFVRRTGLTSTAGRTWRLDISDPVDFTLIGGECGVNPKKP